MSIDTGQGIESKEESFRSQRRSLRQSAQPEISLDRSGSQKNALFQKGLAERPATALPARQPISFSFRPVSPQGRDFANLVTGRRFIYDQWLDGWHGPAEFKSASGWQRELGSKLVTLACQVEVMAESAPKFFARCSCSQGCQTGL
jgi:hypothetical protein